MEAPQFDKEELDWPAVDPEWTAAELLSQTGMFKFSKIKKLLQLKSIDLTRLIQKVGAVQGYHQYGFFKPSGSQYIVRMSTFRDTYQLLQSGVPFSDSEVRARLQKIPETVTTANQLEGLQGIYLFSDVQSMPPFSLMKEAIRKKVHDQETAESAREMLGIWKPAGQNTFLIELPRFYEWFLTTMWPQK